MPVVGAGDGLPGPVRRLCVHEDDPRLSVALARVRPHVPVTLGRPWARARLLEPRMIDRGVVHDHVRDHADASLMRAVHEYPCVLDRSIVGVHLIVLRYTSDAADEEDSVD